MALHWSHRATTDRNLNTPYALLDREAFVFPDEQLRCGYSSKKCFHLRTTRKGGGLHRFCEFHRQRANKNQWRVDDKRRVVRAERRQQLKQLKRARVLALPDPVGLLDADGALTQDDVQLLQALLLGGDRWESMAPTVSAVAAPSGTTRHPGHERTRPRKGSELLASATCVIV